jgi:glycosyltransferase involved in cell wall biosynthesis
MRVVHVASGRLFGGIEQMLITLARCRGVTPAVDVTFAVAAPGRLEEGLRAAAVEVVSLGDVRLSRPASIVQARSRLGQFLAAHSSDAVICHAPWSFALFASAAARRGIPVAFWQHDHASGRTLVERWARRIQADLLICNSEWTSRTARALQPRAPVVVIHPPVVLSDCPPSTTAEIRRTLHASANDVVVLSASRLEPWKGHLNVLRALGRLSAIPNWRLWIAGGAERAHEREYEAALGREVAQLGLSERVLFLGERRDIPNLMKAADIFCQFNESPEPFGIVFAEALLAGLPVVAANVGGIPEIVSDNCGRLVPAGDIAGLSGALQQLIVDRALRSTLGAAGPAHAASRCDPSVALPKLERALAALGAPAAA